MKSRSRIQYRWNQNGALVVAADARLREVGTDQERIGFIAGQGVGLPFLGDALVWPAMRRQLDRVDPGYRD